MLRFFEHVWHCAILFLGAETYFWGLTSKTIYHLGAGLTPSCQEQIGEAKSYMHP